MVQSKQNSYYIARWSLQLGLAFVLIYAGVDSIFDPASWKGYVPGFLSSDLREITLWISTVGELILAAWLLVGRNLRIPSILIAIFMALIIGFNLPLFKIVFRNVGLLFAALALAALTWNE
ncbi:MAG: DoxX family membrane protein [Candidatus Paceibacteria bacterium]